MPEIDTCWICDGSGEVECPDCGGLDSYGSSDRNAVCHTCLGDTMVVCDDCEGNGYLTQDDED